MHKYSCLSTQRDKTSIGLYIHLEFIYSLRLLAYTQLSSERKERKKEYL